MEIRYFQIIIPVLAFIIILVQVKDYRRKNSGLKETMLIAMFWAGVAGLAIFPDFLSGLVADLFGIKSNINAIIFFAVGLLFYIQLKMYKIMKKQDDIITKLCRKIALDEFEENE